MWHENDGYFGALVHNVTGELMMQTLSVFLSEKRGNKQDAVICVCHYEEHGK